MVRIDWLFWIKLLTFARLLNLSELNHLSRLELLQCYFLMGSSFKEITVFLSNQHGIIISLR